MDIYYGRSSDIKEYYIEIHDEHGLIEQKSIKLREYELEDIIDKIHEMSKEYVKK